VAQSPVFLKVALWTLPLPWLAAEMGWFVAEHGRQPWAIEGVLPTFLAVSPIPTSSVALSLTGFVIFYTVLAVIDVFLLKKYVKLGPGAASPPRDIADDAAGRPIPAGLRR
jgi:cytochrome d ubiquinol oxidase subunit I